MSEFHRSFITITITIKAGHREGSFTYLKNVKQYAETLIYEGRNVQCNRLL